MRRNATVKTIRKNEKRGDAHFGIASRHINKCLLIGECYKVCRGIKITQLETKKSASGQTDLEQKSSADEREAYKGTLSEETRIK